ncbi:transposase family protein [Streptomyces sp. NPDC056831]|uniref:transposase family protein n=1 Tax=Streptomyces sp. NPDC056831 TaxID=3345954 RepID=UPI0036AD0BD3
MSVSSPISPALDQLNDLALWERELAVEPTTMESSPASRLSRVPDRRMRRGRRHRLVAVLVLTACATLVVGNDSITAIGQWADVLVPRGHSRSGSITASTAAWSSVSTTSHSSARQGRSSGC